MDENKNRLMETINRNFKEGGEIVVTLDYEEYLHQIEKRLARIETLLTELPQVMAATMLLMKQEVEEANLQGRKASDLYEIRREKRGRSEEVLENGEVMFGPNAGNKADNAEKHIEPELKPRAAGILTPTFFSGLLLCLLLGFIAGALTFRILMLKHGG